MGNERVTEGSWDPEQDQGGTPHLVIRVGESDGCGDFDKTEVLFDIDVSDVLDIANAMAAIQETLWHWSYDKDFKHEVHDDE